MKNFLNKVRYVMTKKHLTLILTLASSTLFISPVMASESHPGQALHEEHNCLRCHVDKPYNPEKTSSYPKLVKSVRFCNENLGIGLFDEEIDELADYLNHTYYQHKKE